MTPAHDTRRGRPAARRAPLALALATAAAHCAPAVAAGVPAARRVLGIRDRIDDESTVALTFDDGPHAQGTPAVLEALRAAGAPATFFLVGIHVDRHPTLAAEIVAAGHEVALHCHRHRNLLHLTPKETKEDLHRATDAIAAATGVTPRLHRPPYGYFSLAGLRLARRNGWEPTLWARDGHDWEPTATPASIVARLTRRLRGGDILLLHDADYYCAPGSWRRTVLALPRLLETLGERGLSPTLIRLSARPSPVATA